MIGEKQMLQLVFHHRRFEAFVLETSACGVFGIVIRVGRCICWEWQRSSSTGSSLSCQNYNMLQQQHSESANSANAETSTESDPDVCRIAPKMF